MKFTDVQHVKSKAWKLQNNSLCNPRQHLPLPQTVFDGPGADPIVPRGFRSFLTDVDASLRLPDKFYSHSLRSDVHDMAQSKKIKAAALPNP